MQGKGDFSTFISARLRRLALFVALIITILNPAKAMALDRYVWIADPLEPELHESIRRILPLIGFRAERGYLHGATMLKFPSKPYFFVFFGEHNFCIDSIGCLTIIARLDGDRAIAELITYSDGVIGIDDLVITLGGVPETAIDIVAMRRAMRVIRSPAGWVVVSGNFSVPYYLPPHPHHPVPPPPPLSRELVPPTPPLSHEQFKKALERFR